MKKQVFYIALILAFFLLIEGSSALVVDSIHTEEVYPGSIATITFNLKNDLDDVATEISLSLDFSSLTNQVIVPIDVSEWRIDKLKKEKTAEISFKIKAANNAKAGDYLIPYTITFYQNNTLKTKKGVFSISIIGYPEFLFLVIQENQIIGEKGKINLQITNKGLGDAKLVSLKIFPQGYILLSDDEVYLGNINSDDFQSVSLDVIYKEQKPKLNFQLEYRLFDNTKKLESFNLNLEAYTKEKAIQLGIKNRNYTFYIILGVILLFLLSLFIRLLRKKSRTKKRLTST